MKRQVESGGRTLSTNAMGASARTQQPQKKYASIVQVIGTDTCNDEGTSALKTSSHFDSSTATSEKCSAFHSAIAQIV